MKFQPTPSRNSAARKCISSMPDNEIATQANISRQPVAMIRTAPKRAIRLPVTSPGRNMPITCHSITSAVDDHGSWHISIASGVATISRFMIP